MGWAPETNYMAVAARSWLQIPVMHYDYLLGDKMKAPHASPGLLAIDYKRPLCLIWITPNKLKNNPLPYPKN